MIVGVSGSSGSGKTFIVNFIKKKLPENTVSIMFQDNYYKLREDQSKDENGNYNFDLPSSFNNNDFINDIKSLKAGKIIRRKEYNFNNPLVKPKFITVKQRPLIIVEGLFIFNNKKISKNFDKKIFISCDIKKMIKRRIERDSVKRGYDKADVLYKYENHVLPSYKKYILPFKKEADIIIDNNGDDNKGANKSLKYIKNLIGV
tara:strand:+ start:24 stop:632 length:609 start_codon:yes stop_codon:yes gene_type:complete